MHPPSINSMLRKSHVPMINLVKKDPQNPTILSSPLILRRVYISYNNNNNNNNSIRDSSQLREFLADLPHLT